jgi:hypothetical protein
MLRRQIDGDSEQTVGFMGAKFSSNKIINSQFHVLEGFARNRKFSKMFTVTSAYNPELAIFTPHSYTLFP